MKKTLTFGKIAYIDSKKNNLVEITIELKETKKGMAFSAIGGIWNSSKTDYVSGGQNLKEIAKYFPNNNKLQRIVQIWREYHLNDMQAGTSKQMDALKNAEFVAGNDWYGNACKFLESKGILTDNGYEFGSGWIFQEIPKEILKEIESFFA